MFGFGHGAPGRGCDLTWIRGGFDLTRIRRGCEPTRINGYLKKDTYLTFGIYQTIHTKMGGFVTIANVDFD